MLNTDCLLTLAGVAPVVAIQIWGLFCEKALEKLLRLSFFFFPPKLVSYCTKLNSLGLKLHVSYWGKAVCFDANFNVQTNSFSCTIFSSYQKYTHARNYSYIRAFISLTHMQSELHTQHHPCNYVCQHDKSTQIEATNFVAASLHITITHSFKDAEVRMAFIRKCHTVL